MRKKATLATLAWIQGHKRKYATETNDMQDRHSKRKKLAELRKYLEQREANLKKIQEVQQRRAMAKRYIWRLSVFVSVVVMIAAATYL